MFNWFKKEAPFLGLFGFGGGNTVGADGIVIVRWSI